MLRLARPVAASDPIGIFDSGVGGLTILRAVQAALPCEDLVYVADAAHLPYGDKPLEYILERSIAISKFLLSLHAKAIVVACNTATAAAIDSLRERFPVPFIGVEPAVKPAAAATRSGVIGVLATSATLRSSRFAMLVERFGKKVKVLQQPCAGLAEHIERGDLDDTETERMVRGFVEPLLAAGADTILLGCTHYPLIAHIVRDIAGPGVAVVENGSAVASELGRQLVLHGTQCLRRTGSPTFWSSGRIEQIELALERMQGQDSRVRPMPEPR